MKKNQTNKLSLAEYQELKNSFKIEFESLMNNFVKNYQVVKVGDKVYDIYNDQYLIDNVGFSDNIVERNPKLHFMYQGIKLSKTGQPTTKINRMISLRDYAEKELPVEDYLKDKREIFDQYKKIKKTYGKENHEYKKGDRVIDFQNDIYYIDKIEFNDSFNFTGEPYYSYYGNKLLKSGKLSEKVVSLVMFKRITY